MVLYILAFFSILIQVSGLIYTKDLYKPEKFPISVEVAYFLMKKGTLKFRNLDPECIVKAAYFVILEVRNRTK